ncbi:3',5'-cyclic AMP phosphodiesterase CpdA [Saccharopolyspora lacisalsi]|uniref:3',5'-cyclic AMP phosphodiesterase CpdA n=1 Tax=Halosaccharopolyspora lacisalsi TaxID=1000566 RepID=A0A839DRL1_9PSEU|nr:metallophosphoesterase [Halosaccharopolyspora lacisalsi]MBA8823600.1 3',5'-cyclic AMP phosphodiesterase CpdA [Halosaccharopolyspora lacisalsi]
MSAPSLLATSDLHVSHRGNQAVLDRIRPRADGDWLIVAGDVAEKVDTIEWALRTLRDRFEQVLWVPGNHELWTTADDEVTLRGAHRYDHLVELCRGLGVLTPEDPYPVWETDTESLVVAPLFLLYDYSFRPTGTTLQQAVDHAYDTHVVCTDEVLLHPDPHEDRRSWCRQRVEATLPRLEAIPEDASTVLISHWPLRHEPTLRLRYPQFAIWCGTELTSDWHRRFRAVAEVHGHLHIPVTDHVDGVPFEDVSLGYPREWKRYTTDPDPVHSIVPPAPERTFEELVRAHQ